MSSPNKKLSDREVAERIAETERIKAETERIRADLKDGMSVAEVLDKYNISRSTLRTRFKGRIPTPSGLTKSELEKVERKEQAVNMYADSLRGLTYKEIAKKYGVSVDTVRTRLDNLDIDLSPALIQSYRQQEFAKLNLLEQRMWKEMDKDYYVVNRMLKIADRRAKLGGFDNPVKFEVEHNVSEIQVTEVRDLVEQARREALEQENKLRALALDAAVTEDAEVVDDVEG
jgi:Mor family transcriptional regulator